MTPTRPDDVASGASTFALLAPLATRVVSTPGAALFVRYGGTGSPVVLLHGYVQTGDMWAPLAAELMERHTVIIPDLRGLGRSSRPDGGYDKKTQAADIRAVVEALGFDTAALVGHDIGGMVSYTYGALYPTKVSRLVIMESAPPGIAPWDDIVRIPGVWHFNFRGAVAEGLVEGRERLYFQRFWDEFAGNPSKIDEATRAHYAAQYALPGAMRAGFSHFAAFEQDAKDNRDLSRTKLTMPILAVGGEKADRAFSAATAVAMREVATDVREAIVPGAGHWLIEEDPRSVISLVRDFLDIAEASSA